MDVLDNPQTVQELDKSSVLESTSLLPDQIEQAWEEVFKIDIPLTKLEKVKNIVVAGMGGSALGAGIIDSLSFEALDVPLEIIKGYHLPAYADKNSLAIISSYSGNTEETVSCCLEAMRRKCQVFAITTGGQLADLAKKNKLSAYIFRARHNPSRQPRMGLGYSITAQLAILSRCKLIRLSEAQIAEAVNFLKQMAPSVTFDVPSQKNIAKKTALSLRNKAVVLVSSEHLIGATHAFKNMLNENSKVFAVRFSVPEMNHHLLEGLAHPAENKQLLKFLFLESAMYDPEIKKRLKITQNVVEKNGIPCLTLKINGRTRLTQVFETIYLGEFISCYLSFLYDTDPAPIPWVDYFKSSLEKYSKAKQSS